jgi:hypothetical protein
VFVLTGVLAFAQPHQARHPSACRFVVALLASSGAGLVGLVTRHLHDEKLSIGPFVFSGPGVEAFGKVVLGLDSLLLGAAAVCAGASGGDAGPLSRGTRMHLSTPRRAGCIFPISWFPSPLIRSDIMATPSCVSVAVRSARAVGFVRLTTGTHVRSG